MPYPNEHAARLKPPGNFDAKSFRRTDGGVIYGTKRVPKTIAIVWGKLKTKNKKDDKPIPQSLRFYTKYWKADQARKWLKDNKIKHKLFKPAGKPVKKEKKAAGDMPADVTVDDLFATMARLESDTWAMEPRALESFFTHLATMQPQIKAAGAVEKSSKYKVANGTAHIPISGILIKKVPWIFKIFGIEATSYIDIKDNILAALADKKVNDIQLDVDSPGGLVSGVLEAADAIRMAREVKTVNAVVDDLAASGAYWLTSQASHITASRTAQIGSIGVYSVWVDSSKAAKERGRKVIVIKSGPHKGVGIPGAEITDANIKAIQDVIDSLADKFVASVAAGRKRPKKDIEKCATGQVWLSDKAQALGLIDSVYKTSNGIKNLLRGTKMVDEKTEVDAQVEANKIAEQTQAEERSRLGVLKNYFKDDLSYAMAAFEKGKTLTEAKADYCDVLMTKLADMAKERDKAVEKAEAAEQKLEAKDNSDDAEPLSNGDSDNAEATGRDFITEAKALAKEKGIGIAKAMSELARKEPDLHAAFKANCKTKPRITAK